MLQASQGRSGKQEQEHNSPNLGPTLLANPSTWMSSLDGPFWPLHSLSLLLLQLLRGHNLHSKRAHKRICGWVKIPWVASAEYGRLPLPIGNVFGIILSRIL